MGEAITRRRGWRKQPTRCGRMRVSPTYKHTGGSYVTLSRNGWLFVVLHDDGRVLNSLWRDGYGRLFQTAHDAMVAAERALASGEVVDA